MSETFDIRPYDDNPYLIFPGARPFKIKLECLVPTLRAFVYQKGNLFGDALPLELAGLNIICRLYDNSGLLVMLGTGAVIDLDQALIEYSWKQFDVQNKGIYYAEFLFTDIDNTTFVLPSRDRIQVIVF